MKHLNKIITLSGLFAILITVSQNATAQRFSVAVQSGIAGSLAPSAVQPTAPFIVIDILSLLPLIDFEVNNNDFLIDYKESSYGRSWNVSVVPSITFDKGFGFRLGAAYHGGLSTTTSGNVEEVLLSAETKADYWSLNPAVFFELPGNKIRPYIQLGAAFVFPEINTVQKFNDGANEFILSDRVSGNVGIGLTGALGAEYTASEKISIFAELSAVSLSYKGKNLELNLTQNGTDVTVDAFGSKDKTLVEKGTLLPFDPESNEVVRTAQPFSNIGFNTGVRFYF